MPCPRVLYWRHSVISQTVYRTIAHCTDVYHQAHTDAATPKGQTALYDALKLAGEELAELAEKYPGIVRRVLCLTDGEDTTSTASIGDVTHQLQQVRVAPY